MSSQHQEPPTSAKLILSTSHGPLEVELWAKETPLTCKNFIQLCLEGYYDGTEFHRLLPGFMIQGGDKEAGRGEKQGESIYGAEFQDEIHTRLRFTHRGLLAMANNGPNTNLSQFFFTFDACSFLDRKNTIFGKIVGKTIFNLLAMEHLDTDSEDRPIVRPKILGVKVIVNPFEDVVVRERKMEKKEERKIENNREEIQKIQRKMGQNRKLLSFQDEEEEEQMEEKEERKVGIVSCHDVLDDPTLCKESLITKEQIEKDKIAKQEMDYRREELKKKVKLIETEGEKEESAYKIGDKRKQFLEENPDMKEMKDDKLLEGMKTRRNKKTGQLEIYWEKEQEQSQESKSQEESEYSSTDSEQFEDDKQKDLRKKQKEEYENLKIEYLQFKKDKQGTAVMQEEAQMKEEKKLLSNLELKRLQYVQKKRIKLKENEVLQKLKQFRDKINSSSVQSDSEHWMNNRLKFHIDSARAFSHFENKDKLSEFARKNNELNETVGIRGIGSIIVARVEEERQRVEFDVEQLKKMMEN